ncbi:H-NS histone family protein [Candidatus Rhodoblastus alkanivorans]
MKNKLNFESMSLEQLWALHVEVSTILSARILEQKSELERRLAIVSGSADIAGDAGLARSASQAKPRRKYPKVSPQYRNPETFETWSGRGKRPRWLVRAIASGQDMDDFRIKDPD